MIVNKKVIFIFFSLLLLNGCAQSTAFLAPAFTVASTGNIYQAGLQYGTTKAIKKETGKDTVEYISDLLNPPEEKSMSDELVILLENRIKNTRKIIFSGNN
jgi:hypothetical protein